MVFTTEKSIEWHAGLLTVCLTVGADQVVYLSSLEKSKTELPKACSPYFSNCALPLVEVRLTGEGTKNGYKSSQSLIGGYMATRLKYVNHTSRTEGNMSVMEITTKDTDSGISATSRFMVYEGTSTLRSEVVVQNDSTKPVELLQVASLIVGGLSTGSAKWWDDYVLSTGSNSWFREAQWQDHSLPSVGIDDYGVYELPDKHINSMSTYAVSSHGSFSTLGHLPMGLLKHKNGTDTWLWQIEHNGSWKWEIGDFKDAIYMAASGPLDTDHHWGKVLQPGETFTTVPVALCHLRDSPEAAFADLNHYRRCIRRKHIDNETLPIIFNDYMNCLMGDPTEEKILDLLEPVVKAGAEYFVIDCGWYADSAGWWDDVGEWQPSKKRFPSGFKVLLDKIRARGLIPGVWVEPEVVGTRSIVAEQLPHDCFFQRNGQRIIEKDRYQLDFRNPRVIEHMDSVIDNLVLNYGVGYFKFDYNINILQGTDVNAHTAGDGQLGHNRAYLSWIGRLYDRHSDLVIESCSSGAQRLDYAMLAMHSLQSTSDQQDPVRYAAISAAMPTAVTPEQSASWAYPQPEWSDEINAMTVVNSLLGRVHLSGRLDRLNPKQLALVCSGMQVYKDIRSDLPQSSAFWPLGLPGWHDEWVALGISGGGNCYLAVWRRGGPELCSLPMSQFTGKGQIQAELLYPKEFPFESQWDSTSASLNITLTAHPCARLIKLRST
ncbi:glycoside hydrolase family 36 protein [Coleophoma crateriformis]|uniref:alpha-galactosidase n=1 Tax=Coleophoma crateriformis TaxID=565419 RepID=A0A3D8Q9T7_9HELO|nr:glycoside hydrolase family 36 protein [Coleophoma crateriformis]